MDQPPDFREALRCLRRLHDQSIAHDVRCPVYHPRQGGRKAGSCHEHERCTSAAVQIGYQAAQGRRLVERLKAYKLIVPQ
jgi:hypothetical protein